MKYAIEDKFGKFVIVQTEEPYAQIGPDYPDKKTAQDQLRRLTQRKKNNA